MIRRLSARLLALALALAAPAFARADVVSARADKVAVTIYRDGPLDSDEYDDTRGLAFVVESREVDLPAGRSRVKLQGVADGIIPESAAVGGLPGAQVERNFDYDLLGPGSLIARSVGKPVKLVRTNPKTGQASEETAILRSGPDGVVLDFGGGRVEALHCSGAPEKLVFDHAPPDLAATPTLSVLVDAPAPGHYRLTLSYLTVRMNWAADYIARIAPDGKSLSLSGWITLANHTAMSFADAPTAVVAGRLSRVEVDLPDTSTPGVSLSCWPLGNSHHPSPPQPLPPPPPAYAASPVAAGRAETVEDLVVTAEKRVSETRLGDYRLYSLVEPTTVAARQTKQVAFLEQPKVTFETLYAIMVAGTDSPAVDADAQVGHAETVLRFDNKPERGLGRGLPSGVVRVLQPGPGGAPLLVGEPALERDVPVGEPFELKLGEATDVNATQRVTDVKVSHRGRTTRTRASYEVVVTNAKATPVIAEVRHFRDDVAGFRVTAESDRHGTKAGDPLWRLVLPAGGQRTLTYAVEYDEP